MALPLSTILNFDGVEGPFIKRGASWVFELTFRDKETGIPEELSYYTGKLQIRKNYDSELIVELSTQNGRLQLLSGGKIKLRLTSTETALLKSGSYLYDLFLTDTSAVDSNGDLGTLPILEGTVVIKNSIII